MACPVKMLILFVLNVALSLYGTVVANKTDPYYVELEPHEPWPVHLRENEDMDVTFTMQRYEGKTLKIVPVSQDPDIAEVSEENSTLSLGSFMTANFTVKIKGKLLGRTKLKFFHNTSTLNDDQKYDTLTKTQQSNNYEWYELRQRGQGGGLTEGYDVIVSRQSSALSHIFTGTVILLVSLANIAMGCKTELGVVKEVLKKPIGPLTGMFSQFGLMPLIALAVIYMLKFDPVNALGFFAMSCSPGGSASNLYTYLLDGDVSLSVTMTLCSTLLSIGMIPLWLFTVGTNVLYHETEVKIPFTNILYSLVGLLVPVVIGMLIQWKKPNWAKYIVKGIRPLMVVFFVLVFTLGIYSNLYIFTLMRNKPEILLAGALIPYIGFLFGGLVAFLARQNWKRVRTIAIETGIQNTGVTIVLLKMNLPAPDDDISIVAPIAAAIFTPIPMLVAIAWYEIYKRCYQKKGGAYLDDMAVESDLENDESKEDGSEVKFCNGIKMQENNNAC